MAWSSCTRTSCSFWESPPPAAAPERPPLVPSSSVDSAYQKSTDSDDARSDTDSQVVSVPPLCSRYTSSGCSGGYSQYKMYILCREICRNLVLLLFCVDWLFIANEACRVEKPRIVLSQIWHPSRMNSTCAWCTEIFLWKLPPDFVHNSHTIKHDTFYLTYCSFPQVCVVPLCIWHIGYPLHTAATNNQGFNHNNKNNNNCIASQMMAYWCPVPYKLFTSIKAVRAQWSYWKVEQPPFLMECRAGDRPPWVQTPSCSTGLRA